MKNESLLFVWHKQGYKSVRVADIIVAAAARSYCDIVTTTCGTLTVSTPLREVLDKITHPDFVRIHKSHAINLHHIDSLQGNMVCMSNGEKLMVGREYRDEFYGRLTFVGAKGR